MRITKGIFTEDTVKLFEAIRLAAQKHAGQYRRGTNAPYVTHSLAVTCIVAAYKRSGRLVDLLCAAVPHDALEDTDLTHSEISERFGPLVASLVLELSNDEDEIRRIGKKAYQMKKMLGMSSYGLVLKLADRLDNISDRPPRKMIVDTLEIMAALKEHRKLSKPQTLLIADIERICHLRLTNSY